MLQEIEFWRLVIHNSDFLIHAEKLSFEEMQNMNAILDMNEDHKKAIEQYYKIKTKIDK